MSENAETSAGEAGSPDPLSNERLAEIRAEFGPKSVYLSGVAGDGVCVMGNELLDEIDRLNLVLDANRVVRNAAESSNRVHKAMVDRLKTERTRLRAELDKCAGLNRELVNEAVDATTRAETAERELAEVRERIGEAGVEWSVRWHEDGAVSGKWHTEAEARERGAANPRTMAAVRRLVGEWKAAGDG